MEMKWNLYFMESFKLEKALLNAIKYLFHIRWPEPLSNAAEGCYLPQQWIWGGCL